MAEAAVLAVLGGAATASSQWVGPSAFTARHEESHRKEMGDIQLYNDRWYNNIPDQEVDSDEEKDFQRRRDEARQRVKEYGKSIQDYKGTSMLNPVKKIRTRNKVRASKRKTHELIDSFEDLVQRVSTRSQANSRASSRSGSEASTDTDSTIATTDSPPDLNLRNESILDWSHGRNPYSDNEPPTVTELSDQDDLGSEFDSLSTTFVSLQAGGADVLFFKKMIEAVETVIHSLGSNVHVIFLNEGTPPKYLVPKGFKTTFLKIENLEGGESEQRLLKALHNQEKGPAKMIWMKTSGVAMDKVDVQTLRKFLDVHFLGSREPRPYIVVDQPASIFYYSPLLIGADIVMNLFTTVTFSLIIVIFPPTHTPLSYERSQGIILRSPFEHISIHRRSTGLSDAEFAVARQEAIMLKSRMKESALNAMSIARTCDENIGGSKWIEEIFYPGYVPSPELDNDIQARIIDRAKIRYKKAWETLSPRAKDWIQGLPKLEPTKHDSYPPFPTGNIIIFRLRCSGIPSGCFLNELESSVDRRYPTVGLQTKYGMLKFDAVITFHSLVGPDTRGLVIMSGAVMLTVPTGDWRYFYKEFHGVLKHLYETHEWEERLKEVSSSTYLWGKGGV
ncbi:hypothetical protein BDP27DRAFT_1447691 [Rhodocollybia butyracea]|uniref:Uncharacterized protein n=1 Tax=Rhodocollybia butyracea TaxID=206335 RepID=A0A9P5PWV3_9AGAR|nr:hypothetical protein BDP27DRAFT_1447691 [Rhodocollybia butyracea]